jgi:hypothetical protein
VIALDGHPRARAGIRRARFGGGLAMAAIAGLLAYRAGVPTEDVLIRALIAGVVGHLACWALAIAYFRAVALAEIEHAVATRGAAVEAARRAREEELQESA